MIRSILQREIKRIAIIDDEKDNAQFTAIQLRRLGVEPILIEGRFQDSSELVETVIARADAAICDNYLQQGDLAAFYGAEPVAQWYDRGLPALLYTQYLDQDDFEIRQYLSKIPRVLNKDEVNPEMIASCLNFCFDELNGEISLERQACRTLVKVKRLTTGSGQSVMDVIVPSWNMNHAVRLPMSMLSPTIAKQVIEGTRLFAFVNTGAESPTDLFFENFELAPDPLTEDEVDNLYHS